MYISSFAFIFYSMFLRHFLLLLLHSSRICICTDRSQNAIFKEVSNGRMGHHTVLMYFQNMNFEECIHFCMRHIQCASLSYNDVTNECELNDMEYDDLEGDPQAVGWKNYYRPAIIHGKFSVWKVKSACSATCGLGTIIYYRLCDHPTPQYGGDQCEGAYERAETCNVKPCHQGNVALGKKSSQASTYDNKTEHFAKFANDGDYKTNSVTDYSSPTFWQVDLQEPIQIRLIKLYLTQYALKTNKYKNLTVLTSMKKDKPWNICRHITVPTAQVNVTCNNDKTVAQFVRVEIDANTILYLTEVEVYSW